MSAEERMTIYVDDKDATERWIKQLEIDYDVVLNSSKVDIYQAIFSVAAEHEQDIVKRLQGKR